jgi:predicted dehydrogenase
VETEVRDLLRAAEACVERGKHIHLDKPAGESLPKFRHVLDRASQQGLIVQLGYMYRYNPGIVLLRQFLERGWLGEIFEVHTVMSKVVDVEDRKRFAEYPGGILFELGGHVLDSVLQILGKPEEVTGYRQHASSIPDSLQDNMLAVLRYPKALATVKVSAMEVEGFDRRHLVVCGTQGTFHIQPLDAPAVRLSLSQERPGYKRGTQEVMLPKFTRYVEDAADMARVLRGEKKFEFSYEHDLQVQTALLQACGVRLDG